MHAPTPKPAAALQPATAESAEITYAEGLRQALEQAMELSDRVMVVGQLVDFARGVFGSTGGLAERFGRERGRDFPVSESAMTASGIGAPVAAMRPGLRRHPL